MTLASKERAEPVCQCGHSRDRHGNRCWAPNTVGLCTCRCYVQATQQPDRTSKKPVFRDVPKNPQPQPADDELDHILGMCPGSRHSCWYFDNCIGKDDREVEALQKAALTQWADTRASHSRQVAELEGRIDVLCQISEMLSFEGIGLSNEQEELVGTWLLQLEAQLTKLQKDKP